MATSPYISETVPTSAKESVPVEVILALLAEYSAKVTDKTEEHDRIMSRLMFWFFLFLCIFVLNVMLGTMAGRYLPNLDSFGRSSILLGSFSTTVLIMSISVVDFRRLRAIKREVRGLSLQLKRIVDRASAIDDHSELSFGRRFELDIRLNEAESALERAEAIIKINF